MLTLEDFRRYAHEMVDYMAGYFDRIESLPVRAQVSPGQISAQIPQECPAQAEPMEQILADVDRIVLPGMTHWQSPGFMAFFPANSSYASVIAEMLTAAFGAQCMKWETSPAATEVEGRMVEWLRDLCALPSHWQGVIQDSATSSTLTALLTARERASGFFTNRQGLQSFPVLRVYCSEEAHSSIEKAVKVIGIGSENLVKIPVDQRFALRVDLLEEAIQNDLAAGFVPCCVVAALGTTGVTAFDPLEKIALLCMRYKIWLHVDAAYAGTAFMLPEYRHLARGLEYADSYVFNPHKWLFVNFDCSVYYVKDKDCLLQTLELVPEYLRSLNHSGVNNYCDWGLPLGRRFRALKLWFVLRSFGADGIRTILRNQLDYASWLEEQLQAHPRMELLAPRTLNLLCFRYVPHNETDNSTIDTFNELLLNALNQSGKVYMTHTRLRGRFVIRLHTGQTYIERRHVEAVWNLITATASELEAGQGRC